jgi:stress responsive alpha/beta barrel protein
MIDHIVMLKLQDPTDLTDCAFAVSGLAGLVGKIPGFLTISHGPNIDVEGKSQEYPYGFIAGFRDRAALARYAADPRHLVFAERLAALCGGADGIRVYDIERG